MRNSLRPVWLIAKRELRDQLRDWRILSPLIILTIGFPFLMNAVAYEAVGFANQYGGNLIVDRLVPFSVLIIGFFPLTISLLGALESFVGEKERGTIEPLLGSQTGSCISENFWWAWPHRWFRACWPLAFIWRWSRGRMWTCPRRRCSCSLRAR